MWTELYIHPFQLQTDKFDIFWAITSSVFGIGVIDHHDKIYKGSMKITFLTTFLAGSVFFYAYQAFLISSLAVPSQKLPFQTPEGILDTSYK